VSLLARLTASAPSPTVGPEAGAFRTGLRQFAQYTLFEAAFYALSVVEPFGLPVAVFWALQLGLSALTTEDNLAAETPRANAA
jgi:hypothetical protein